MSNRIILDTNCLIVSVPKLSKFRWIYDKVLNGELELVVTSEILLEYEEKLSEFYSPEYAELIVKVLINLPNVIKINPISFNWLLIDNDVDDNKFVDAYVASNASIIITNDKHFNVLNKIKFPPVAICKIAEFKI